MVRSMTGYGRFQQTADGMDITVEIKSVNHRYYEYSSRIPRAYGFLDDKLKSYIQRAISRGKVDVFITIDETEAESAVVAVNKPLAEGYLRAIGELERNYGLVPDLTAYRLARFPDVLTVTKAEEDLEAVSADICAVLTRAISAYNAMRETEGAKLAEDLLGRLDTIEALTAAVEERSPQTVAEYREKLLARMQEVLNGTTIDESRILTEAAIFADKVAVDEETVRLRSHLSQLRIMLQGSEPVGRKLDFLIQEVNREANTIGSKCNDVAIARKVVDLKAEVEKIREQVQNIE